MATSIGIGAYQNAINMISYPIGPNITSIGEYAFYNCYNLQTITIPASVGTIGANAFARCSKLTSVYFLGNGITDNFQFTAPFPTIYVTSAATGWASSFSGCNITRVPAVVGAELPGGIKVLNPSPTDAWSGTYSCVDAANLSINRLVRYKTMIVRIVSDLYWYRDGIEDANLVLFNGGKYNSTVPNLTLTTPTKGGVVSTNIESGLAYTAGSLISVVGTPVVYYLDVTSSTSITFNQAATVDVFMIGGGGGGHFGATVGGGGGGGSGGGAGAYKNVSSISVTNGTKLDITVGAGGVGGTTGRVGGTTGGDTYIQSGTSDYQSLRAAGGETATDSRGGSSGTNLGGYSGLSRGGGGGGSGGAGGDATFTTGGTGGDSKILVLDYDLTFGSGGGGGRAGGSGANGTGTGYGGGGGSFGVAGGAGGSGRVILKVTNNINPFSSGFRSYPDTTASTYKFEGIVSSYNRTTGAITIGNIQNIYGAFSDARTYTFNVNTLNGANAGTNIEIIDSKVNLSINSDIQMNDKKLMSPTALYLTVPFTTQALSGDATNFMLVNVNGSNYKIKLFPA